MELVIERATIGDVTEIAKLFDAYRVFTEYFGYSLEIGKT